METFRIQPLAEADLDAVVFYLQVAVARMLRQIAVPSAVPTTSLVTV